MMVNEIHGNVLMHMVSVTYNTHTSRIIYEVHQLLYITLTIPVIPVTSATAERTFSAMRRLKKQTYTL